jgi:hypothetical protein
MNARLGGAPHIAVRLRQHLDAIFRRAIISGRADNNPVAALKVSDVLTLPATRHIYALETDELKRGYLYRRGNATHATGHAPALANFGTDCRTARHDLVCRSVVN